MYVNCCTSNFTCTRMRRFLPMLNVKTTYGICDLIMLIRCQAITWTNVYFLSVEHWTLKCQWHLIWNFIVNKLNRKMSSANMMTSSNGNIFRVTGPLCGEFTGPGEFPTQRPVTRSFHVFFDLRLNKRLSKQSRGWWFETLSHPLWRHRNESSDHFLQDSDSDKIYSTWIDTSTISGLHKFHKYTSNHMFLIYNESYNKHVGRPPLRSFKVISDR